MIWFNIKNLENKISKNELTDRNGWDYVLAYFVLTAIVLSFVTNNSNGWIKLSQCVISVLINVWGLKAVYEVNTEVGGNDFFKRFFAISWVIGMRLIVAAIILIVVAGIVIGIVSVKNDMNYNYNPSLINDMVGLIFMAVYTLVYYLLIIKSFRRLKRAD